MAVEIELKFSVPKERRDELRRAMATTTAQRQRLAAVYFDTPAQDLARAKLALRLRRESRLWVQTLKAEGATPLQRLEHNVPLAAAVSAGPRASGAAAPGPRLPPLELARHDGTPAGKLLRRTLRKAAEPVLLPRYATQVDRLTRRIRHQGALIELALDVGHIKAGARMLALSEIEFELLRGPEAALLDLASRWVRRFALVLDVRSKSERGEHLAAGSALSPPASGADLALTPGQDADVAVAAMLGVALSQTLANAASINAGGRDAEFLHQLRVGLRRLRNVLRVFSPMLALPGDAAGVVDAVDAVDADLQARLSALYARLGATRDRDVVAESLWPALREAGAPSVAWPAETSADVAALLAEPTTQQLWLDLLARVWRVEPAARAVAASRAAGDLPVATIRQDAGNAAGNAAGIAAGIAAADGGAPDAPDAAIGSAGTSSPAVPAGPESAAAAAATTALRPALRRLQARVRRDAARFEQLDDATRHQLRRRLKRLSDAAELSAGLWPRRRLARLLRRLQRARSRLGELNDTVMALDRYRSLTSRDASLWFAVGWLSARRQSLVAPCAAALARLAALPPMWRDG